MNVKKITVIGSGTMGLGIAHVGAIGGYDVVINDISLEVLEKNFERIKKNMAKGVELGKLSQGKMDSAISKISLSAELKSSVEDSDLVIEAIPERIDLKLQLMENLDNFCKPDTVFATNTSGLSITEMAGATRRPEKVIGMHFFNPVHKMKLVEIIRGLETSDETYQATELVSVNMGKETVEVNESPGFVTSRINAMIGNEAFYMLQEGVASARGIDKALKLGLNHPMGPFEMIDLVGLDTRLSILKYLQQTLGEKYRPCPLIEKYVKAGRLGKKVGKGVYDYE
ncbi:MAG: 3-hydroxyacyl-CoA dehydrogenase [Calditrichaeota bacterium]|nr:MAG: 3-hydroxyacyl-CoA dehydrogenase [Calditrichota bacterium]